MARMGLDPGNPDDYIKYEEMIKNREPKAKGGSAGSLSYKKMFGDLDKTLNKGISSMFRKRRR
jgi:hypothetical protein